MQTLVKGLFSLLRVIDTMIMLCLVVVLDPSFPVPNPAVGGCNELLLVLLPEQNGSNHGTASQQPQNPPQAFPWCGEIPEEPPQNGSSVLIP